MMSDLILAPSRLEKSFISCFRSVSSSEVFSKFLFQLETSSAEITGYLGAKALATSYLISPMSSSRLVNLEMPSST